MKYHITYTCDEVHDLDDDFIIVEFVAHSQADADLIIHNIERFFHGVTIECHEEAPKPRRRRVNSDKRTSKSRVP